MTEKIVNPIKPGTRSKIYLTGIILGPTAVFLSALLVQLGLGEWSAIVNIFTASAITITGLLAKNYLNEEPEIEEK